jgi:hypothetical protein
MRLPLNGGIGPDIFSPIWPQADARAIIQLKRSFWISLWGALSPFRRPLRCIQSDRISHPSASNNAAVHLRPLRPQLPVRTIMAYLIRVLQKPSKNTLTVNLFVYMVSLRINLC